MAMAWMSPLRPCYSWLMLGSSAGHGRATWPAVQWSAVAVCWPTGGRPLHLLSCDTQRPMRSSAVLHSPLLSPSIGLGVIGGEVDQSSPRIAHGSAEPRPSLRSAGFIPHSSLHRHHLQRSTSSHLPASPACETSMSSWSLHHLFLTWPGNGHHPSAPAMEHSLTCQGH